MDASRQWVKAVSCYWKYFRVTVNFRIDCGMPWDWSANEMGLLSGAVGAMRDLSQVNIVSASRRRAMGFYKIVSDRKTTDQHDKGCRYF